MAFAILRCVIRSTDCPSIRIVNPSLPSLCLAASRPYIKSGGNRDKVRHVVAFCNACLYRLAPWRYCRPDFGPGAIMASRDKTLMRLDKAVKRLERALDLSQDAREGVSQGQLQGEPGDSGDRMRELEERLRTADSRLGSVISELKTMLERGDAPGDGTDQRS